MNKRKLKPQVKVILIILGIVLALIMLENIIRIVNGTWKKIVAEREYNKQQELYEQTPIYREEQYIAESVEQTIQYINDERYEDLFSLLDPEYKEIFAIDTLEKFKEIIKNYIGDAPKDVTLLDYGMQNGRYICNIAIQKEGVLENKQILITPLPTGEFYIVPEEIQTIEKFDNVIYTVDKEIEYNLKYKVVKNDERILIFDVKNKTSKQLVGSYKNTTLEKGNRKDYKLKNKEELEEVILPSNENIRISFVFDNKDSYIFMDDSISFKLLLKDGTEIKKQVNLEINDEY